MFFWSGTSWRLSVQAGSLRWFRNALPGFEKGSEVWKTDFQEPKRNRAVKLPDSCDACEWMRRDLYGDCHYFCLAFQIGSWNLSLDGWIQRVMVIFCWV